VTFVPGPVPARSLEPDLTELAETWRLLSGNGAGDAYRGMWVDDVRRGDLHGAMRRRPGGGQASPRDARITLFVLTVALVVTVGLLFAAPNAT
jgi:hypothetical protein